MQHFVIFILIYVLGRYLGVGPWSIKHNISMADRSKKIIAIGWERLLRPRIPVCRLLVRFGLIAFICCVLSGGFALNVDCEDRWVPSPQSGTCVKGFLEYKSWNEARQDCQRRGGDLVKVLDRRMDDWLVEIWLADSDIRQKILPHMSVSAFNGLVRATGKKTFSWLNETSEANYIGFETPERIRKTNLCIVTDFFPYEKRSRSLQTFCYAKLSYICEKIPVKLCPKDWYPNSHAGTCIKVVRQHMSWHKARAHCQTLGGDLTVILDEKVDQFLSDQTVTIGWSIGKSLWIGLNDLGTRGNFKWLDNIVDGVYYTNWKGNQPDSQKDSNCVKLSKPKKYELPFWDDTDCNESLPFICEKFTDCEYEQYGMFCPKSCKSALCADDQAACNRRNGICQNACSNRTYGVKCSKTCSSHCGGPDKACHITDGSCLSGCEDGYKGDRCETVCSKQTYGANCSKVCSPHCGGQNKTCDHMNGSCVFGCADGYTGLRCETVRSKQTYGANCSKVCCSNCGGQNKTCDHMNGSCVFGCADGYTGLRCETVCSKHTYGANCSKFCSPHCGGQNKTCDHRNGSCLSGCADGYTGLRCETENIKPTRIPRPKYTTAAIVCAATFASVVFLTCFSLWILIIKAENEVQEMSTVGEQQYMRQDKNTVLKE